MSTGAGGPAGRELTGLRLAWGALLVAVLACAALGAFAVSGGLAQSPAAASAASVAVAGAGVLCGIAALLLDRSLLAPQRLAARVPFPDPGLALRHLLAGHLALWSIAALPAILGFAQLILGGSLRTHLALCALSLGILACLMPTQARISRRVEAIVAGR